MRPTQKSADDSSFFGTTIQASVKSLKKILGYPEYDGNDGKDKVNFEWTLETDSGHLFTVYDWKSGRKLKQTEIVSWHIGGFSRAATEEARAEIQKALR